MYKEYFEKYKTTKDYRKAEISEYYIMLQDMASMLLADEEFFILKLVLRLGKVWKPKLEIRIKIRNK